MYDLFFSSGTGHSLMVLSIVIGLGLLLGKLKVKGLSFGAAWILFVGILFSALGIGTDSLFLHFLKEFGLLLFVFSVGLQVGPGIFHSFRKEGLRLNISTLLSVLLCVACVLVIYAISGEDLPSLVGSMTGAVTNTPGLGTAQQSYYDAVHGTFLAEVQHPETSSRIAHAFAIAYPVGILGVIGVIALLRRIFRIDLEKERVASSSDGQGEEQVVSRVFEVENPAVFGKHLSEVTGKFDVTAIISGLTRQGKTIPATEDPVLEKGDRIQADLNLKDERIVRILFGKEVGLPSVVRSSKMGSRMIIVTKSGLNGKKLRDLSISEKYGVTVTRVVRSGVNLVARDDLYLLMGDSLKVIGDEEDINRLAEFVGNSSRALDKPNLIPVFIGIGLGIILGAVPIRFPGMSHAAHLGIAGGTLLVAILIGYFGPTWGITTYTTASANRMIREIGLSLLLGTVGLGAGGAFVQGFSLSGWHWILYAAIIAVVPTLLTGLFARYVMKMNFFQICGLLTGATLNSPVLDCVEENYKSHQVSVSFAMVYPLAMFLQVVAAELLILLSCA